MEPLTVRVWNYRGITQENPLEFVVAEGITFVLGMNNIGKSNILRLLLEFRGVFQNFLTPGSGVGQSQMEERFFFDEVVNRKTPENGIKLEVSGSTGSMALMIKPVGPSHTKIVKVSGHFTASGGPDPSALYNFQKSAQFLADTMYIGAFRGVDFAVRGTTGDIAVGQEFVNLWSKWAGGDDVRNRGKIDELENELKELLEFKRFGIRLNEGKDTLLVTTDDGQFKLGELGGGVGQLILILGNAAIRNPSFILIDEPEIGLHPRMQEVLVRALAAKAKQGLIATSHSVGLARSVSENIVSITKLPTGAIKLAPFGQHYEPTIAQSINELGYSQFVDIGGNNILLVEGRTDIKAFREILRKYEIETSFIILSFGGGEFVVADEARIVDELNEIKRLNPKSISVIFDSDVTAAGQPLQPRHQAFKDCCERLGFSVFPTDWSATENYITQTALDKVLRSPATYQALGPYDSFNSRTTGNWDKNKNWLLFREMSKSDFASTALHTFIEGNLVPFAS